MALEKEKKKHCEYLLLRHTYTQTHTQPLSSRNNSILSRFITLIAALSSLCVVDAAVDGRCCFLLLEESRRELHQDFPPSHGGAFRCMGNESWLKSLYELYERGIKVGGNIDDRGKVFIIFIVKFKWIGSWNMLRRPRDAEDLSCFYVKVVICFGKRFNSWVEFPTYEKSTIINH